MRYNYSYTVKIKTAISISDPVFASAEQLAQTLGISRSALYTKAVVDLLERHRVDRVTERLNEVYANEDSTLDPAFAELQRRTMRKSR